MKALLFNTFGKEINKKKRLPLLKLLPFFPFEARTCPGEGSPGEVRGVHSRTGAGRAAPAPPGAPQGPRVPGLGRPFSHGAPRREAAPFSHPRAPRPNHTDTLPCNVTPAARSPVNHPRLAQKPGKLLRLKPSRDCQMVARKDHKINLLILPILYESRERKRGKNCSDLGVLGK